MEIERTKGATAKAAPSTCMSTGSSVGSMEIGMAGFYVTKYLSSLGGGEGAFYVGHGIVVGTDALGGIYEGTYEVGDEVLTGSARLTVPGGGLLATGQQVEANEVVDVRFSLPSDFATGKAHPIEVGDHAIRVVFRKVRDLP